MKASGKKNMAAGGLLIAVFVIFTGLIRHVDVKPIGPRGTHVGFAALNGWFHACTGVNMTLYVLTDWLSLAPLLGCMIFACLGLAQWIKRRSFFRVDADLLILGVYYMIVIGCYAVFEMTPVNYRPILIGGALEASYPSSTTLLVLGVTPTLAEQAKRRIKSKRLCRMLQIFAGAFSALMVIGRLISGVHWLTDIAGALLLSAGLFNLYVAAVATAKRKENG